MAPTVKIYKGPLNINWTTFIMGEKVKVNKTDRQLLSNWIYTLFKHQTLHSMEHCLDLKRLLENAYPAYGSEAEGGSEQIHMQH